MVPEPPRNTINAPNKEKYTWDHNCQDMEFGGGGGGGGRGLSTRYCRVGAYKKRITNPFFNLSYTTTTLLASPHQTPSCWFTKVRILDVVLGARASLDVSSKSAARSGSPCRQPCSAPSVRGRRTNATRPRGPRPPGTGRGCGWARSWRSPEHSGSEERVEVTGSFHGAPLSLDKMMTGKLWLFGRFLRSQWNEPIPSRKTSGSTCCQRRNLSFEVKLRILENLVLYSQDFPIRIFLTRYTWYLKMWLKILYNERFGSPN